MNHPTAWPPSDVATLRESLAAGLSTAQTARLLGRSAGAVTHKARSIGLTLTGVFRGNGLPSRASERDAIAADLRAGRSMLSITKERRIDKAFVAKIRDELDLPRRPIDRPGMRDQVVALLRAGGEIRAIARQTGVSRPTVTEMRDDLGIAPVKPRPFTRKERPQRAVKPVRVVKPKVVKPARIAAPVPARVVTPPAPVEVRGKPGVWGIPVGRTLEQIEAIAAGMAYPYGGLHDLPAFNKHRVNRHGLPPLAVNFTRGADFALPGILRSRII